MKEETHETSNAVVETSAVSALQPSEQSSLSMANSTVPGVKQTAWSETYERMQADPRMTPAPTLALTRDPFESSDFSSVAQHVIEEKNKALEPVVTPNAVGLVLTGIIIGPERRVAQINGRSYAIGQVIDAVQDQMPSEVQFKLVEVRSRVVVLESKGRLFELEVPDPAKSGNVKLSGIEEKN